MNALLKNPVVNLAFLISGLVLQAVAMFEFERITPMRGGLMSLAASLLVIADWRSLGKANVTAFLGWVKPLVVVVSMASLASCAWLKGTVTDGRDCMVEASKGLFIKALPEVRSILAEPSWERVEAGLTALVKQYGQDFVWCLVARAKSDAMMLGSDGSGVNGTVTVNAERWMGE